MGPTRQPHLRVRAADGRAPRGSHSARPRAAKPARLAGGGARAPMVAGGGHRHGGAAAEREEGKGEKKRRSTAHPRSTATTKKAARAEEGGGAARVDGVDGVPAVGDRNGGVDEVGEDAAKPKEAAPRWEVVRGDDGGGPELDGDGGERERWRELDSGEEEGRREAETDGGGAGRAAGFAAAAALGRGRGGGSGGRKGMTGGPHPSARVAGWPTRQRRVRGERPDGERGEERDGEGDGPSRPKREREGNGTF
uniref:Pr1-like protein n=1 Tax=Oryza sativa subsp. japonica TaxID=39947 RepID=Q5Z6S5_ORYSJ|nr:pr1-like protein [Oryza sativa Japonica Group]BAD54344.1 pr1-like protein [Oryza sativa Japonica Group]